jgi:hypothetical protein
MLNINHSLTCYCLFLPSWYWILGLNLVNFVFHFITQCLGNQWNKKQWNTKIKTDFNNYTLLVFVLLVL